MHIRPEIDGKRVPTYFNLGSLWIPGSFLEGVIGKVYSWC